MKKIMLLLFLLPFFAHAQVGWQWGKISNNYGQVLDQLGQSVTDTSGNVFVALENTGDSVALVPATIYNPYGYNQTIIVKYDSLGNLIWAIGTQSSSTEVLNLAIDDAGNLYYYGNYGSIVSIGTFTLTNTASSSGFLIKISPAGNVLWGLNTPSSNWGSIGSDYAGNLYLSGTFANPTLTIGTTTLHNEGVLNVFLTKYSPDGNLIWAKCFGGNGEDYPTAMTVAANGNIYLSGQSGQDTLPDTLHIGGINLIGDPPDPVSGNSITYLAKYDSSGNVIWAVKQSSPLYINSMSTDLSGSLYIIGGFDSTIVLGSYMFSKEYYTTGFFDVLIAKYDATGNIAWAKSAGAGANAMGWSISPDLCGNVWCCVSGSIGADSLNFDGHSFGTNPFSDDNPIFMIEYDTSGTYHNGMFIASGGGENNLDGCTLSVDNKGGFYIAGDYLNSTTDMIFGLDTIHGYTYSTTGENFFIAKYKYDTVLCSTELMVDPLVLPKQNIIIYPNPATRELTISATGMISTIVISNLLGLTVYNNKCNSTTEVVDVSNLPTGVYFVKINGSETGKFVKE